MGCLGQATNTVRLISAQTSQEGMECTKTKEIAKGLLSNLYTVLSDFPTSFRLSELPRR